eukprot:5882264-Prymnesium_polylepis.1
MRPCTTATARYYCSADERAIRPPCLSRSFTPVLREAFEHMVNAMQRLPLDVSLSLPEMADAFARQLSGPQMVMVEE